MCSVATLKFLKRSDKDKATASVAAKVRNSHFTHRKKVKEANANVTGLGGDSIDIFSPQNRPQKWPRYCFSKRTLV